MTGNREVPRMVSSYLVLALAIALEVLADVVLEYSRGFTVVVPSVLTLVLFVSSIVLFSRVLLTINLSVAYATWSVAGILATTAASLFIFHDKVTVAGAFGIVFLVVGVILVNLNASAGPSL